MKSAMSFQQLGRFAFMILSVYRPWSLVWVSMVSIGDGMNPYGLLQRLKKKNSMEWMLSIGLAWSVVWMYFVWSVLDLVYAGADYRMFSPEASARPSWLFSCLIGMFFMASVLICRKRQLICWSWLSCAIAMTAAGHQSIVPSKVSMLYWEAVATPDKQWLCQQPGQVVAVCGSSNPRRVTSETYARIPPGWGPGSVVTHDDAAVLLAEALKAGVDLRHDLEDFRRGAMPALRVQALRARIEASKRPSMAHIEVSP